jgi:hypothetical protein
MMVKSAQPGEGGRCTALPLSLYVPTRAKLWCIHAAKRADTLSLFLLYPYMYSVVLTYYRSSIRIFKQFVGAKN